MAIYVKRFRPRIVEGDAVAWFLIFSDDSKTASAGARIRHGILEVFHCGP